jgi:CPA2 family monovalent cation:H+ antiporter-2
MPARAGQEPMDHSVSLIATIAVSFMLAFVLGFGANKLRLPPLVGYLLAGVAVGPFTPGFVADAGLAGQLAEVGVILLMFGVGLHFSPADLSAVRGIALPGAAIAIAAVTAMGAGLALAWGWALGGALVFGLCLSVASTVVVLRALEESNGLGTPSGRIAVGWLIAEDLVMVLVLVLLPALAEVLGGHAPGAGGAAHGGSPAGGSLALSLAVTLGKVMLFIGLAIVLGPRVVPWLLQQVARTGSRELFTLSVLAVAIGIAYGSAQVFGVSFALGAFFAGLVLSESPFGHRAAAQSLPMQDAFAVLFFVSVGMLFDPTILVREPLAVIEVLLVIVLGKAALAFLVVLVLGYPAATGVAMAAALARIGEFSFILAALGVSTGLLPTIGRDLVVAGALLSITLSAVVFAAADILTIRLKTTPSLRRYGQKRLAVLQERLEEVRRKAEAREAEHGRKIEAVLGVFPVFAGLDEPAREDLLLLFRPTSAQPGDRIIRQGDRPTGAYFLSKGIVQVDTPGGEVQLGPGDFFGEMALLSGARRSATVTALDFCDLFFISRRDFLSFLARHPGVQARVNEVAEARRKMNDPVEEA